MKYYKLFRQLPKTYFTNCSSLALKHLKTLSKYGISQLLKLSNSRLIDWQSNLDILTIFFHT